MTELDRVIQTRTASAMGPEVQTVYLVDEDGDVAAYLVRSGRGEWSGYIEACLDPNEPTLTGMPYDEAVYSLLEADAALVPLPLVYSLDPVINRA